MSDSGEREEDGADRPQSPTPSLLSVKSDRSLQHPPDFTNDPPDTEQTFRNTPGQKTFSQTTSGDSVSLQDLKDYKVTLDSPDGVTYVTEDLHLSAGGSEGVNQQHEVWQLETASNVKTLHDVLIKCRAVFKTLLPGRDTPSSRVLTNGIAGIGKTFSVRKFALDWARGLENQDIILLVPFSFRELNLVRDEQHSLLSLIHVFHPTLKKVTAEQLADWKVGFIFDGLDESRFPLKFENIDIDSDVFDNNDVVSDVTVTSSVGVLLTNLIKGNLLPSALLWITTRPAAANQIPPACVDMVTEIRGFTDPQKEEFFRERFSDKGLASTTISHVKTSKSIHTMCHIPLFCWMTATVVEDLVKTGETGQLPKNLTGMFSHFMSLRDTFRNTPGQKTFSQTTPGHGVSLQEDLKVYKVTLDSLYGVPYVTELPSSHSSIYTDLHLSAGGSEGVNKQHEVWQLETASNVKTLHDVLIKCCAVFKTLLPGRDTPSSRVLTNGFAGIGKTFSVRKFALDWARGLENQDIVLLVPFSFRELNLVRDEQHSLLSLIHVFHPTLKKVTAEQLADWKVGFIFDGLDESRFPLKFENIDVDSDVFNNNDVVSDVTVTSSVGVLLTNLIKGNLLPSALLWITTRPAAANQIPPACVDMVTEIQGFTDPQKEEFFRKMFSDDEELASTIISHMETSKSIHTMCHIPVFCWMTATVVEDLVKTDETGQLPKSLTGMFSHFMWLQIRRKKMKYDKTHEVKRNERKRKKNKKDRIRERRNGETDRDVLLELARLAFEHLEKGTVMFYQEDLEECGLDVNDAALYSGVCTAIFKEETVQSQRKVYSFVHLIIQEFLAAVYLFHCFTQRNMKVLKTFLGDEVRSLEDFLQRANIKALKSTNGHLDLFVRFLHGLSLQSNQGLLGGLLGHAENSPESIQRVINNLKEMQNKDGSLSPDRFINISHCLMEMNDHSVHQKTQQFLKSADKSRIELSESQCSALASKLLTSEDVLEELDLDQYNTPSLWGKNSLIPAVRNCRKARLVGCCLQKPQYEILCSALSSNPSHLRELDISYNDIKDPFMDLLTAGLKSPKCQLEILRLVGCAFSQAGFEVLLSALRSNRLHLRELDLSFVALRESQVLQLSAALKSPQCRLQILGLSGCGVTEEGCSSLASAVTSNPSSQLKQMDLHFSHLGDSGLKELSAALETVNVNDGGERWIKPQHLTNFQRLTLDTNTACRSLVLSENNRKVTRNDSQGRSGRDHPDRFDYRPQVLSKKRLDERCYTEIEFSGSVVIGVADRDIGRKGRGWDCVLGWNEHSWGLFCRDSHHGNVYSVMHNCKDTFLPVRPSSSKRVAVYLDRSAGTLSFYRVLMDTLTHLYTFENTFTEPLYAGFSVDDDSSVSMCEEVKAVCTYRLWM